MTTETIHAPARVEGRTESSAWKRWLSIHGYGLLMRSMFPPNASPPGDAETLRAVRTDVSNQASAKIPALGLRGPHLRRDTTWSRSARWRRLAAS